MISKYPVQRVFYTDLDNLRYLNKVKAIRGLLLHNGFAVLLNKIHSIN